MSRVSSPCCCIKIGGYGPKNDYTSLGTKMEGVNIMFKRFLEKANDLCIFSLHF